MTDIFETLKNQGIELTAEQRAAIETDVKANYRTIADYQKATGKRDEYKAALDKAAAKPDESGKVAELESKLAALSEQFAERGRQDKAKQAISGKKFANVITERAVLAAVVEGLTKDPAADPVELLRKATQDAEGKDLPGVFVTETEQKKARFTAPKAPGTSNGSKPPMSEEDILKISDPSERQRAWGDYINTMRG